LVYDHSEQVCSYCHQSPLTHAKSGEIFLPCGHYNVACRGVHHRFLVVVRSVLRQL
jgi:hypothetical protein